ncbi:MAG: phosphoribosylanthranilate isomerase [Candidatus Omnitrophica bacterium]|nr:phosphoribosylanthranilate isomerase [Candidatus Omnitrophota bacterium]
MAKVKICGNTNIEDAKAAISFGADYIGFIFTESKRKIDSLAAHGIIRQLPHYKNFVGVFCNQPKNEVKRIAQELGLKILQFHGDETARYCQYFMDEGFEVIKTFHIKDAMSLKRLDEYNVTSFLFDTYSKDSKGGTGIPFDWKLIGDRPFVHEKLFIAGGLNVQNVAEVIEKIKPFAVDVASGVEKSPGRKDLELLEQFIRLAKGEKRRQHA